MTSRISWEGATISTGFLVLFFHLDVLAFRQAGKGIHDPLLSMLLYQRIEYDFHVIKLHIFFLFVDYLFPLYVNQGILLTRLHTHRLRKRRFVLAHVAFQGETGIGFFKIISGWAAGRAEAALGV